MERAGKATLGIRTGADGTLSLAVGGAWRMHDGVPASAAAVEAVAGRGAARVRFDASALEDWDGSLLALVE